MRDIFSLPKNNSDPATRQDGSDEDTPLQRLRDVYCPEDRGTSLGDTNDANGNQRVVRDNLNVLRGPVCAAGGTPERDANAKKRKSVSFEDDVIVYLFDQESPTSELHCEARTAPPDGAFGDTGLEWEDDFSALEKRQASTPPTPSGAALPRRFALSQTCLFLTHVSESDLELRAASASWKN
ncbi:serine/threonine-protein kinase LMTK2 isoform X3 [Gasterosteus aculeatus]